MTSKEQSRKVLRRYLCGTSGVVVNKGVEFIRPSENAAREALQSIGGMAGTWGNYPECTYYTPQRINGAVIDLSTLDAVRAHYDAQ